MRAGSMVKVPIWHSTDASMTDAGCWDSRGGLALKLAFRLEHAAMQC